MSGWFIAFEGADASGKSTQATLLGQHLGALVTRQPGDTGVGRRIRSMLLEHSPEGAVMTARTEALLYAADRAQHVAEVVRPVLAAGRTVVCDRYIASSLAYQSAARGLPFNEVRMISEWATEGLWPDLTVLLRVSVDVAMARLARTGKADRLEAEGASLLRNVIASYDEMAARHARSWRVVDGEGSIDEIAARVREAVDSYRTSP